MGFLDFGIDAAFNYCIDDLVLVDLDYLKPRKRERYLGIVAAPSRLQSSIA